MSEYNTPVRQNLATLNIPLMRKALEWVEAQEELEFKVRQWNQAHWFIDYGDTDAEEYKPMDCGTAYCLAGYIAIELEGWKPTQFEKDSGIYSVTEKVRNPETGRVETIPRVAILAMGLDNEDGDKAYDSLFEPGNDAATIREIMETYAGEKL